MEGFSQKGDRSFGGIISVFEEGIDGGWAVSPRSHPPSTSGEEPEPKKGEKDLPLTNLGFTSRILHADIQGGTEHGAIHNAIQPSVTYGHQDVRDLIGVFQNRRKGYAYSRNSSPSLAALERKVTLLEGGLSSLVFASGLAAISTTFFSLLQAGDHLVVSKYLFGNTHSFFNTLIRLGFKVDFVDVCQGKAVSQALKPETKFFFTETIANPGTQIPDWGGIIEALNRHGQGGRRIVSIIDNTLTTPYLFSPREWGFSFSVNSLTKYMAGQGSALAGSLTDLGNWRGVEDENILPNYRKADPDHCQMLQIRKKGMRDMGPTLSPYAAHIVSLGMETLSLRMEKHLANALTVAEFLEGHPKVAQVFFPGLKSHPQHGMVGKWYRGYGAILSFVLKHPEGSSESATSPTSHSPDGPDFLIRFLNDLKLIIKSSHLGDTRTLAIPVATTIFNEMGVEERSKMGIYDHQIRLSIGIEDIEDIIGDLRQAFDRI